MTQHILRFLMLGGCLVVFRAGQNFGGEPSFPRFRHHVIDADVGKVCYAVTLADVDGDQRQDIVAVTENRVLWYQSPDWTRHVIIENQTERDNVCIAAADIDGDGKIDFALGAGWTKIGTLQWLSRADSLDQKWHVHGIDQEPWLHRMQFADVLGTGTRQLVISPLNKTAGDGVRLTAFEIPQHPKTDRWQRHLMDGSLNKMHNHAHIDFNGDGTTDTITASEEGVFWIRKRGESWTKTQLGTGSPAEGAQGAGEIKVGRLKSGSRFLATVEPMHGTSVVVYTEPQGDSPLWQRHVLDDTLQQGHAVWTANLDVDKDDELIIGHREPGSGSVKGPGLYVYDVQDDAGVEWKKHVIDDGGVAVEDAIAADLNGDGHTDLVAGGRATHNVKLYVNLGP